MKVHFIIKKYKKPKILRFSKSILVLLIVLSSCTEIKKNSDESKNISDFYLRKIDSLETFILCNETNLERYYSIDSLKNRALKFGDTSAYYKLSGYYLFNIGKPENLFMVSYQMATKYHYNQAYFDLFNVLYLNKGRKVLDTCSNNMAKFYLLLAYENGCDQSKHFVNEIFGNKNVPHSDSYKKTFCY